MLIVDAQVHMWSDSKPSHRQVDAFTAPELLSEMEEAGVDAAIIHPLSCRDPNANE